MRPNAMKKYTIVSIDTKLLTQHIQCQSMWVHIQTCHVTAYPHITVLMNNYIPSSNLLFWNRQFLPSKGIESWNLAQTQMDMENGSVNNL